MTLTEFQSLKNPGNLPPLLQAMWYDLRGDWKEAHELAQDVESVEGAWIHAYLHRQEGDHSNANYWYHQAGRKFSTQSLSEERQEIVHHLLAQKHN